MENEINSGYQRPEVRNLYPIADLATNDRFQTNKPLESLTTPITFNNLSKIDESKYTLPSDPPYRSVEKFFGDSQSYELVPQIPVTFDQIQAAVAPTRPVEVVSGTVVTARKADQFRRRRLGKLGATYQDIKETLVEQWIESRGNDATPGLPYMTPRAKSDTFEGTKLGSNERHRQLTPRLQQIMTNPGLRRKFMRGIDEQVTANSDALKKELSESGLGAEIAYDVVIIGTGAHGQASASRIRELFPDLKILMIDENERIGGQFRSYGDNPAFYMNSRVRRANRNLPNLPRTPGNINPLGDSAPLELSDFVTGTYADNTEIGDALAVNAFLSADDVMVSARFVDTVEDITGNQTVQIRDTKTGELIRVRATKVMRARGISQTSAIARGAAMRADWYEDTAGVFSHFGNKDNIPSHSPLEKYDGKTVYVIGGGDSALCALEALLGKLPPQTYGMYGPGRFTPKKIVWVGAEGATAGEVQTCLRSRYVNGIVQAMPKSKSDAGAIIKPIVGKVESLDDLNGRPIVRLANGEVMDGADIVIDCTNMPVRDDQSKATIRYGSGGFTRMNSFTDVGPGSARPYLPSSTREAIRSLGISANAVALWALMAQTIESAESVGYQATLKRAQREARAKQLAFLSTFSFMQDPFPERTNSKLNRSPGIVNVPQNTDKSLILNRILNIRSKDSFQKIF